MSATRSRRPAGAAEKRGAGSAPAAPRAKPLKRPLQARARFTVQAIYDAFTRIWRLHGWEGVSTRAVALETGISVGTLYEYFPSREALLSGYVRHCIDVLLREIEQQVILPSGLAWQARVRRLVRLTCGIGVDALPYFDAGMLTLEHQIAEPKHHRRVYDEILAAWFKVLEGCQDLPARPAPDLVRALYVSVWGGRRYMLLVDPQDLGAERWVSQMETVCCMALASATT